MCEWQEIVTHDFLGKIVAGNYCPGLSHSQLRPVDTLRVVSLGLPSDRSLGENATVMGIKNVPQLIPDNPARWRTHSIDGPHTYPHVLLRGDSVNTFHTSEYTSMGGSMPMILKKEKGAALRLPSAPFVVTSAMGRGTWDGVNRIRGVLEQSSEALEQRNNAMMGI